MRFNINAIFYYGVLTVLIIFCLVFPKNNKEERQVQPIVEIPQQHNTDSITLSINYNLSIRSYEKIIHIVDRITAYNPVPNQTNEHPFTMASNRTVYEGAVAVSQDIIDKYNLKFGDLVYIPSLNRTFIYEDKMAYGRKPGERKITNTIDILMYDYNTAKTFLKKNEQVVIYKISRKQ